MQALPSGSLQSASLWSSCADAMLTYSRPKRLYHPHKHERLIHGIDGLAEFLGISKTKAMSLRKSGAIDQATTQLGRRLVFDPEKLMKLLEGKRI